MAARELPPPVNVSGLIKFFRYCFLAAGVFYGISRKTVFAHMEANRKAEKERLKAKAKAKSH